MQDVLWARASEHSNSSYASRFPCADVDDGIANVYDLLSGKLEMVEAFKNWLRMRFAVLNIFPPDNPLK